MASTSVTACNCNTNAFAPGGSAPATPPVDIKALHAKIGELTLENDFLEDALEGGIAGRKA